MTEETVRAACEAILFVAGEPLETSKIAQALETDAETVVRALDGLEKALDERGSGIRLLRLGGRYQLCSRAEYAERVRSALEIKRNVPLSPAAMEVLAIAAYNQPVTKAYIERIRGVDCSGVASTLCQRGLLEERGRLDLPGRPLLYGTTPNFLRCFGLSSLSELPELPDDPDEESEEDRAGE